MTSSTLQWIGEGKFVGTDSTKHSVVISTGADVVGMKPTELVLVGLSACTAVDVVGILEKKKQPLSSLVITASAEHDSEPPWPMRKIHVKYTLSGEGLTAQAAAQAIELSEKKYCSVAATLRGVAEITTEFEIV